MKNTFKSEQELLDYLDTLPIAPLRIFVRNAGVTPRNHPRQELVDKVVAIYRGDRQPESSKYGRPVTRVNGKLNLRTQKDFLKADRCVNLQLPRQGWVILGETNGVVRCNIGATNQCDYYLDRAVIKEFSLVTGDKVNVLLSNGSSGIRVATITAINDQPCDEVKFTTFNLLTACHPTSRVELANKPTDYALRVLDLVAPLGRGQRGLIVAPPRTGKTTLIQKIALAVQNNAPDVKLSVLLVDQTPEEITDFKENLSCDVFYTTFDQQANDHVFITELVFANAIRRVEQGQHVMLLVDSVSSLVEAYRKMGEENAISKVKMLFGNARCVKNGGSLTVLATALNKIGDEQDEQICQSLGRIANMIVCLDRRISQKRIFPAIDINQSGTDKEDLLLTESQAEGVHSIRRMLSTEDVVTTTEQLLEIVTNTASNDEAIEMLKRLSQGAETRRSKK